VDDLERLEATFDKLLIILDRPNSAGRAEVHAALNELVDAACTHNQRRSSEALRRIALKRIEIEETADVAEYDAQNMEIRLAIQALAMAISTEKIRRAQKLRRSMR
jgi:hypothetical protein